MRAVHATPARVSATDLVGGLPDTALRARDVRVAYHRVEVLRAISLDLRAGEWLEIGRAHV